MISKQNYQRLIPSLMVATSLILSACQEAGRQEAPRRAPIAAQKQLLGRAELTEEQKLGVFDPRAQASYGSFLSAQIEKLSLDTKMNWAELFTLKTWILGSLDGNKNINIIATSSADSANGENAVVARQSQFEILIDKASYEKMNAQDQAKILLGEFLQGLYTLRNLSNQDLCLLANETLGAQRCKAEALEGEAATEEVRVTAKTSLDQEAHNQVLGIRNYILSQGANLRADELLEKMSKAGFDLRVLKFITEEATTEEGGHSAEAETSENDDKVEISSVAMESLFAQLQAMDHAKTQCLSLGLDKKTECQLQVQKEFVGKDALVNFALEVNGERLLLESVHQLTISAKLKKFTDKTLGAELTTWQLTGRALADKKIGSNYRANFMLVGIEKTESGELKLKLEGLLSVPGSVTAVTTDKETGKSTCSGVVRETKDMSSDIVLIGAVDKYSAFVKQNLEKLQTPRAPCW